MAQRAEDLIGQYLTDLFAPAAESAEPEPARLKEPAPPINACNPAPDVPAAEYLSAAPIPTTERLLPVVPAHHQPGPPSRTSSAEVTLAEPARQQLQQLLNSAWQAPVPVETPAQPEAAVEPRTQASALAEAEHGAVKPPVLAPSDEVLPDLPLASAPIAAPAHRGKPAWANKTFDTLLVDVAGLKLAIPLVVLGHIFQVREGFAHLPGQGPLFLGTLNTPRGPLRVINTALLVMPERYDPGFIEQVQFVVSLAAESARGQPWQLALAVNRVAQPVNLACEDVVWRGERSKRPWLLGTVKSHMCALLDVDVIGQMLTQPAGF